MSDHRPCNICLDALEPDHLFQFGGIDWCLDCFMWYEPDHPAIPREACDGCHRQFPLARLMFLEKYDSTLVCRFCLPDVVKAKGAT